MRKLFSVFLNQYCPGVQIEKNEMDGARGTNWESIGIHRVLVGKREVKRPLGRPRRRWEDNKIDIQ